MTQAAVPLPPANSSAGYLSVRVEGGHAVDIPFQFEQQSRRMGRAVVASFAPHAVLFVVALFLIRYTARSVTTPAALPFERTATSSG